VSVFRPTRPAQIARIAQEKEECNPRGDREKRYGALLNRKSKNLWRKTRNVEDTRRVVRSPTHSSDCAAERKAQSKNE
jgi:hypothetical protein